MNQVWHIFKKDVRHLRYEIGVVAALALVFAYAEIYQSFSGWSLTWGLFLSFFAAYLIAAVIHAEAIPGDKQFWITRPYRWRSLLAAKFLFILAFVSLPICFAQLLIVLVDGFAPGSIVAGLLWSQLLILLCVAVPVTSIAAVTRNLSQFVFSFLCAAAVLFLITSNRYVQGTLSLFWPSASNWIGNSTIVIFLTLVLTLILYAQYRHRSSRLSRLAIIGVAVGVPALAILFPPSWELAFQAWHSPPAPAESIQIGVDSAKLELFRYTHQRSIFLDVPIRPSGAPGGTEIRADAVSAELQWPDGQQIASQGQPMVTGNPLFVVRIWFKDPALFDKEREQPATLHVSAYLTMFGNAQSKTVPIQDTPANLVDNVQCRSAEFDNVLCRAPFRLPASLIYVRTGEGRIILWPQISYSPFPANLNLSPIGDSTFAIRRSVLIGDGSNMTIVAEQPIAHFHRDAELHGIRLADLHNVVR